MSKHKLEIRLTPLGEWVRDGIITVAAAAVFVGFITLYAFGVSN